MCKQVRGEQDVCYVKEAGKTCPTEILEAIASINAEGRPIWKPMHMQPIYRLNPFVVRDGNGRARSNAYIAGGVADVGIRFISIVSSLELISTFIMWKKLTGEYISPFLIVYFVAVMFGIGQCFCWALGINMGEMDLLQYIPILINFKNFHLLMVHC